MSGDSAGFHCGIYDSTNWSDSPSLDKWKYGLLVEGASATVGGLIGGFGSSAVTTSAIPFSTAQNIWSDGQLTTFEVHGSSASNLTGAYCAKVGRFRHVVTLAASGAVAHETYGLMGQCVVKEATLQHLHAGLIGTFEGHTSGVVSNGAYAYSVAGVMARVGGGGAITATKPVCGMVSLWNGAALASGSSIGFGNAHLTTAWTYGFANAVGSVVHDMKLQAEDAGSLPCVIHSGSATDDSGMVSDVGADNTIADGSLYISVVDGAGKLFQKQNDTWVDLQA